MQRASKSSRARARAGRRTAKRRVGWKAQAGVIDEHHNSPQLGAFASRRAAGVVVMRSNARSNYTRATNNDALISHRREKSMFPFPAAPPTRARVFETANPEFYMRVLTVEEHERTSVIKSTRKFYTVLKKLSF